MANRIPFPSDPENGDYYTEDGSDIRWQYNSFKKRWSLAPLPALATAYIVSETTPGADSRHLLWVDPSDGTQSYWDSEADAWVVTSGSGSDGEDGEDLTSTAEVVNIATTEHTIVLANIDKYLRFTALTAKTVKLPVLAATAGNLLTIRNAGTGDLTIQSEPALAVQINAFSGGLVLAPATSAQLIYVAANQWDLL